MPLSCSDGKARYTEPWAIPCNATLVVRRPRGGHCWPLVNFPLTTSHYTYPFYLQPLNTLFHYNRQHYPFFTSSPPLPQHLSSIIFNCPTNPLYHFCHHFIHILPHFIYSYYQNIYSYHIKYLILLYNFIQIIQFYSPNSKALLITSYLFVHHSAVMT